MYKKIDNYSPININKCETCVHYHACLECCHNRMTGVNTDTVDRYGCDVTLTTCGDAECNTGSAID